MPLFPAGVAQVPNYWNVYGHSYFMHSFGTRTQAGRADSLFRNLLNVDHTSFANLSVTGSKLTRDGCAQGGYVRLLQNVTGLEPPLGVGSAPYVAGGGSYLLTWGINDLATNGNTSQANAAYAMAMRMAVSRCRASVIREDDYSGAAGTGTIAYGASWSLLGFANDIASGANLHQCSATATSTVTITLPSDYNGEVVCLSFVANPGVAGGTFTLSGTAGVTGTISTSNILPVGSGSHSPVVQRITTLTSANASQTIILNVTALDAGATVFFDGFWLEATNPPPVLVCNTARLTAAGYTTEGGGLADADVNTFNAVLPPVVAEFDGMVQIVDIDSALNKDATLFSSDGLHPNELGAAKMADAILAAVRRLPANRYGIAAAIQPPSPRTAAVVIPAMPAQWYTSQTMGLSPGTAYTAVAGDVFAIPFEVTSGISTWSNWSVELATSTVATGVDFCIYDDRRYVGYPQQIYQSVTNIATTGLALAASPGIKTAALTRVFPDPGLYWLVLKIVVAGTTTFKTLKGPSLWMPNLLTTGGLPASPPCGWFLSGKGTGVLPNTFFTSGATAVDNCPMVGLLIG